MSVKRTKAHDVEVMGFLLDRCKFLASTALIYTPKLQFSSGKCTEISVIVLGTDWQHIFAFIFTKLISFSIEVSF
jgi:hypothetical protein